MWGIFRSKPSCPVEPEVRAWIDDRFNWLLAQLGANTPARVRVILPTPEFFPDAYAGTADDAQKMFERVADYMGVDHTQLRLYLYQSDQRQSFPSDLPVSQPGTAGLYHPDGDDTPDGRRAIGINTNQLDDPMALVATLAHELAHEILIGQGRVTEQDEDHEQLTDLVTVYLGLGIFNANNTIQDRGYSSGLYAGWRTGRAGYLDQRMFGYALARFAMARGEHKPKWMKHIRADVRAPLKQSLRLLAETH